MRGTFIFLLFLAVSVVAEQSSLDQCLSDSTLEQKRTACAARGGLHSTSTSANGCTQVECQFALEETQSFSKRPECPDVKKVVEECRVLGLRTLMNKNRGCLYAKCVTGNVDKQDLCAENDPTFKGLIVNKCLSEGGEPLTSFDVDSGCPQTTCSFSKEDKRQTCSRDIPQSVYKKCENEGGELVVKFDDLQCVTYQKCLLRREEVSLDTKEVTNTEELDASDLLSLALKLETLATKLDALERKSTEISAYYENTKDETKRERYARVAGMFSAAEERIADIKENIANVMEDKEVSSEEVFDIKHDVKYIKDVILNDILVVMLEREKTEEGEKNCDTDEECFASNLRVCAPALFYPEDGITVKITGIKENGCGLEAEGKELSMTCEYPNYAFGLEEPQELIPYCTGSMVSMLEEEINGDFEDDFKDEGPPKICVEREITDPKECFELTIEKYGLPPFCQGLDADECFEQKLKPRIINDHPPECQEAGVIGFECGKFMMKKFGLPFECKEQKLGEDECMKAIFSGEIDPEEESEDAPPECKGISEQECEAKMARFYDAPDECFENDIFIGRSECEEKMGQAGEFGGQKRDQVFERKFEGSQGNKQFEKRGDIFQFCRERGITSLDECEKMGREGNFEDHQPANCAPITENEQQMCEQHPGHWMVKKGKDGCPVLECIYDERKQCPSVEEDIRECKGGRWWQEQKDGCAVIRCEMPQQRECRNIDNDIRECKGRWTVGNDGGCPEVRCEEEHDERDDQEQSDMEPLKDVTRGEEGDERREENEQRGDEPNEEEEPLKPEQTNSVTGEFFRSISAWFIKG